MYNTYLCPGFGAGILLFFWIGLSFNWVLSLYRMYRLVIFAGKFLSGEVSIPSSFGNRYDPFTVLDGCSLGGLSQTIVLYPVFYKRNTDVCYENYIKFILNSLIA